MIGAASSSTVRRSEPLVAPGWYADMPMADYLAIEAMSSSGVEAFRRYPLYFKHNQDNPRPETQGMREGTALHLALLEPEKFKGKYISLGICQATKKGDGQPCYNRASVLRKSPQNLFWQYCGQHDPYKGEPMPEGVEVMPADALERIEGGRLSVLAHPDARQFFEGKGASELVGIWIDPDTGVLCKLRLDRQIDRADHIHADLKFTVDASREGFRRIAGRLGYHRKAAWYRRGLASKELGKPASASVFIAVESPKPHGCQTFILDETQLKRVGEDISGLLWRYRECLESGIWPGYDTGLRHLEFAKWDMPEEKRGEGVEWDDAEHWTSDVDEEVGF